MKKLSIMVPCYNEEENVVPMSEALVKQLDAMPEYDYEIPMLTTMTLRS